MNALNKNVRIRFIIQRNKENQFPVYIKNVLDHSFFQIKTIDETPPACIGIYDQKTVLIDTSSETKFVQSPVIWSNNPSVIGMAQIYFESIWSKQS